jgi:hypothetical protein
MNGVAGRCKSESSKREARDVDVYVQTNEHKRKKPKNENTNGEESFHGGTVMSEERNEVVRWSQSQIQSGREIREEGGNDGVGIVKKYTRENVLPQTSRRVGEEKAAENKK